MNNSVLFIRIYPIWQYFDYLINHCSAQIDKRLKWKIKWYNFKSNFKSGCSHLTLENYVSHYLNTFRGYGKIPLFLVFLYNHRVEIRKTICSSNIVLRLLYWILMTKFCRLAKLLRAKQRRGRGLRISNAKMSWR